MKETEKEITKKIKKEIAKKITKERGVHDYV